MFKLTDGTSPEYALKYIRGPGLCQRSKIGTGYWSHDGDDITGPVAFKYDSTSIVVISHKKYISFNWDNVTGRVHIASGDSTLTSSSA